MNCVFRFAVRRASPPVSCIRLVCLELWPCPQAPATRLRDANLHDNEGQWHTQYSLPRHTLRVSPVQHEQHGYWTPQRARSAQNTLITSSRTRARGGKASWAKSCDPRGKCGRIRGNFKILVKSRSRFWCRQITHRQ